MKVIVKPVFTPDCNAVIFTCKDKYLQVDKTMIDAIKGEIKVLQSLTIPNVSELFHIDIDTYMERIEKEFNLTK